MRQLGAPAADQPGQPDDLPWRQVEADVGQPVAGAEPAYRQHRGHGLPGGRPPRRPFHEAQDLPADDGLRHLLRRDRGDVGGEHPRAVPLSPELIDNYFTELAGA